MRARFRYRLMKIALSLILLGPSSVWSSKRIRKDNDPAARRFRVRNFSMSLLEINWINIATEERVLQFELALGASDTLNSHIGHEFEIREKPNKNGECKGRFSLVTVVEANLSPNVGRLTCIVFSSQTLGKRGICRRRFFQISDDEDQGEKMRICYMFSLYIFATTSILVWNVQSLLLTQTSRLIYPTVAPVQKRRQKQQ